MILDDDVWLLASDGGVIFQRTSGFPVLVYSVTPPVGDELDEFVFRDSDIHMFPAIDGMGIYTKAAKCTTGEHGKASAVWQAL